MKMCTLLIEFLLCSLTAVTQLQLVSSERTAPVAYPTAILDGGEQGCPSQEQLEMALARNDEEVRAIIGNLSFSEDTIEGIIYIDCRAAYEQGQTQSGVYTIKPDNEGDSFAVYCDMETDGGGWTVFQRRQDGSQDFYLFWEDYDRGFGNLSAEFWLGLSKLHRLTANVTSNELRIDLEDFFNATAFAQYTEFGIGDSATNYTLTRSGYSGTAGGDGFTVNRQFSTRDRDNDPGDATAVSRMGAWWYGGGSNLNGLYLDGPVQSPQGVGWFPWKGHWESLKFTEMKVRRI